LNAHCFLRCWLSLVYSALTSRLPTLAIRALVPKFHLQSHEEKCHSNFLFNYSKVCGRADGEGVERNWDELNGQAPSTAEMVPGHRWETLNDSCAWANFRKTMGLGTFSANQMALLLKVSTGNLLLKRLLLAIPKARESRRDFINFDKSLHEEIPDEVKEMERDLAAWELNRDCHSGKNCRDPYRIPKSSE
jgi:hypothetical protein